MKLPVRIETERLVLRRWKLRDLKNLYVWCKDEDLCRLAGFPALHNYLQAFSRLVFYYMNGTGYAIALKETDSLIGSVSFMKGKESHLRLHEGELEAGYWIGREYWGHGYAKEACQAALEFVFQRSSANAVFCVIELENHQSYRVQEKLGFHYNRNETIPAVEPGKKVSCAVFEITRLDWRCSCERSAC